MFSFFRALYVSLPLTLILSTLVCVTGIVIYATYHSCDPLLLGHVRARDQVIYVTYHSSNPLILGHVRARDQVIYVTYHSCDPFNT